MTESPSSTPFFHLPPSERPRERLARLGPGALSDRELLAILLGSGTRQWDVMRLSQEILHHFEGELTALAQATTSELETIPGVGPAKAMSLAAAFELSRRIREAIHPPRCIISSPEECVAYMRPRFRNHEQEEFHVMMLDARRGVIREELVTLGLLDRSLVHAREVFRSAIRCASHQIMVSHNHPSGDPLPSADDRFLTTSLILSGKLLDIELLDHVIIGSAEGDAARRGFYSFASNEPELWTCTAQAVNAVKRGKRREAMDGAE